MTFDFSRVNWLYITLAIATWLALVWSIWRNPNPSDGEQHARFLRENPSVRLTFSQWLRLVPTGGHGPVLPGRTEAIIRICVVFWFILLVFLVFGLKVVRFN